MSAPNGGVAGLVFLSTFFADVAWAKYFLAIAEKQSIRSAAWSAALILLGGITVIGYTENKWMIVPAALGAFIGTWWTVRHEGGRAL